MHTTELPPHNIERCPVCGSDNFLRRYNKAVKDPYDGSLTGPWYELACLHCARTLAQIDEGGCEWERLTQRLSGGELLTW